MNVEFFYKDYKNYKEHEVIITSFAILVSKVIALPPIIDVCLYDLGENVYGGLDRYRINKIAINYELL